MTPNRAFVDEVQFTQGGQFLTVNGRSLGLPEATLVGRHVALHQTHPHPKDPMTSVSTSIGGPASQGGKGWTATLRADGFTKGAASAIGFELYYIGGIEPTAEDNDPGNADRRGLANRPEDGPSYESYTWSQIVKIP